MKQTIRISLLCLSLATSLPAFSYGDILSYENQLIDKVDIEVVGVPAPAINKAVLSRIKMHPGELFSQHEFDGDLKALSQEFDQIEPTVESVEGHIYITIKVWPKPLIRTISWNGNKKMDKKTLAEELGISSCTVFDRIAFHKAFQKLRSYYVKKGFYEAELNYALIPVPHSNEVDISIDIEEGRAGKIKELIFVNFTAKEREELEELMYTKKYNLFTSWITDEGTYHEEATQQDKFAVLNYLHNHGYADATVAIDIFQPANSDAIIIKIIATRAELYTIDKLTVSGNTLFSEETIRKQFTICEGGIYSPEKIRETVHNISTLYGKYGYIEAYVNYTPHLEPNKAAYSLHLVIEEGEQYCVGMIKVFGNCSTQTKAILHETLLVPGEIFNIEKMRRTEERLENIGFFSSVNVYAVEADGLLKECGNYRDVHIEVEETNTGRLGAFVGYSTGDKLFGGLNFSENNFDHEGIKNLWSKGYNAVRGGGEYLNLNGSIGQRSRRYFLSWTKPYFMDTPWAVGFDIERTNNRYTSNAYQINAWSFSLHATRALNQFWKVVYHYRLRDSEVSVDASVENKSLREEAGRDSVVSAVGVSYIYDSTNHPRQPTKGFKSTISSEVAGLGGHYDFVNLGYVNSYYVEVNERDVLKVRADLHYILPFGNTTPHTLPLDERLFMGGENFVRGYRPYRLGPLYGHTYDPRGGISLQLASVEYVRRFAKTFRGFVFFDAGALTDKRLHVGRIYTSAGVGFRWNIFGEAPLTFGIGFPLNAKQRDQIKRFFINIEGCF